MRPPRPGLVALAGLIAAAPAAAMQGRWEGSADAAGQAVAVVLDVVALDQPVAFLTLPGRSLQRVRLSRFEWRDGRMRAAAVDDAVQLDLRQAADGRLAGALRQGGHAASLVLARTGEAPPADGVPAAPLTPALAGVWRARYDLGFGPREATLRLAPAAASITIVGRRTSQIAFDEVAQRGYLLMLRSSEAGLSIAAPWAGATQGVLAATLRLGPFETNAEFRREAVP